MGDDSAQFVFMTCRPGAEGAAKREVARREPAWRLAFSRPGFLTFKNAGDRPLDAQSLAEHPWTFAHAHGISLGRISGTQLGELVQQFWQHAGVSAFAAGETKPADLHVWQAGPSAHVEVAAGELNQPPHETPLAVEIERALRAAAPEALPKLRAKTVDNSALWRRRPSPRGAFVLDVYLLEPGEWWIGYHQAVTLVQRWPGGQLPISLPAHAVSRAYAKLEEAIRWSGLPLAEGDECVEIGCAPGGASQALLDRGLFVTGIDPADVDESLPAHPRFRHLKKRGTDVRRREFVGVRWLVADMNIAPQATLDEVEPIITHPGVSIRGLVLTLKLSDWNAAERLDDFAQRVRGWGYRDVRLRQLTTGGQEVCLVALRRKALRRLGRRSLSRKSKTGRGGRKTPHGEAASDFGELSRAAAGQRHEPPHAGLPGPHF